MEIDRNSPLPLYFQLKTLILEKIQQGEWKPGEKLPTEEEIQKKYDVSRATIRQALRELEFDGTIIRQAGRGTFVATPKYVESPNAFEIEISEYNEKGLQVSWKVVHARDVQVPDRIAALMQVPTGTRLFCLERLRSANNLPVGHTASYVTQEYRDKIDLSLAETAGTMFYLSRIDMSTCTAEHFLEVLPADKDDARILEIPLGEPVLVVSRILRDEQSKPFEYFRGAYRWDRFRYHIPPMPVQI
jgi:GntR family transcriptional regulator